MNNKKKYTINMDLKEFAIATIKYIIWQHGNIDSSIIEIKKIANLSCSEFCYAVENGFMLSEFIKKERWKKNETNM